jgi:intracellular sulfur oxidation DsrE/DsrF family protein
MKALAPAVAALLVSGCVSVASNHDAYHAAHHAAPNEARVAFDFTEGNPKAMLVKLQTVELTRKQLLDQGKVPRIVLTFRGEASYFTQSDLAVVKEADRAEAAKVQDKIREMRNNGEVESMEQCNLPLAPRKLNAATVMPEVKVVPNGWIALVEYQQRGYAYIAP